VKTGFIAVAALLAGALLAHFLLLDPGYVVIRFRGYVMEMSVPVMLGLLAAAAVAAWFAIKVLRAPRRLGQAAGRYRSGRAGQKLTRGLIQVAEGNFARGEKLLTRAAGVSDAPLLNYLAAARAAHLMGNTERRDQWLRQAFEESPDAANAVLLTQAEFQIDREQYESALATLRRIEASAPNHPYALTLLGRLYFRLRDWRSLNDLLPRLRKHGQVDAKTLDAWAMRVHEEELLVAPDSAAVRNRWDAVPKNLREEEKLLEVYYRAL